MKSKFSFLLRIIIFLAVMIILPLIIKTEPEKPRLNTYEKIQQRKTSKNRNWEYVKNRVLIKDGEAPYVKKDPILIKLMHATREDSIATNRNFEELR
mgnify:CR=1 FL=1